MVRYGPRQKASRTFGRSLTRFVCSSPAAQDHYLPAVPVADPSSTRSWIVVVVPSQSITSLPSTSHQSKDYQTTRPHDLGFSDAKTEQKDEPGRVARAGRSPHTHSVRARHGGGDSLSPCRPRRRDWPLVRSGGRDEIAVSQAHINFAKFKVLNFNQGCLD